MSVASRQFITTKNLLLLLIAFVFLIFYFPILISERDFWDGSIVSYAWESKDKHIFSTWFDESGWPLTRWLYEALYEFCLFLNLNFKIATNFITVGVWALTGYEIYRLSKSVYKFDENSALWGVLFFILTPFLTLYFSTAFIQLVVFLYLCVIGTRLYLENKKIPLALLFLAISFQHNSNPCLLFALIVLAYVFGQRRELKKDALVLFLLACYYLVFKASFKPYGLYAGYNELKLANALNIKAYGFYLDFFMVAYPALFLAALVLLFKVRSSFIYLILFLALAMFTQFPYVLVGKFFQIRHFEHIGAWDYRFTINSSIVIAIAVVFLMHFIKKASLSFLWKATLKLIVAAAILLNIVYVMYGFKRRADDLIYQNLVTKIFYENKDKFKGGSIAIKNVNNFYHELTNYELNYYLYHAFGEKKLEVIPGMRGFEQPVEYRAKYILLEKGPECVYEVSLASNLQDLSMFDKIAYLYLQRDGIQSDLKFGAAVTQERCK